jgi:histidine triad (HIT) family protein
MSTCVFCAIIAQKIPASIVYEDGYCIAFMDIFPLRPAHVLVVPKRHVQYVYELTAEERGRLFEAGNKVAQAMRASSLQPAALHFNINDGVAAHQTVPHVHLHLLPRYQGDALSFVGSLLKKPVQMVMGPVSRVKLEAQAAEIRRFISGE